MLIDWLRSIFFYRRVVITTIGGRITYRRPKGSNVTEYRNMVQGWLLTTGNNRSIQKVGDARNGVLVRTDEIISVQVH